MGLQSSFFLKYKSGFGVVWEMQGVGNVNMFNKSLKSLSWGL